MLTPHIDGDILVYEAATAAEVGWKSGDVAPFDYVEGLLEGYIQNIKTGCSTTLEPVIFLSTDNNFRYNIATVKPYKGNRKHGERPWHYENVRVHLQAAYNCVVCDGWEADDGLAMAQCESTIICSRDKDLRQVEGWHYSWEKGCQAEIAPFKVEGMGDLGLSSRVVTPSNPTKAPYTVYKCRGTGMKWFYAQCLMGDAVDNIPGCKGVADLGAYNILKDCETDEQCLEAVLNKYKDVYGEEAEERLLEQGRLVWMVRELDEEGNPVMWSF